MQARPGDELTLLRDGAEAFPAWLQTIAEARRELLLEMYWFASDGTGWRFAEALAARAREGLDVFVLYDAAGSLGTDRSLFEELQRAGVVLREYHPLAPWRAAFRWSRVWRRDHRKLLVADGEVAYVGGLNLHDAAAPLEAGGRGWRDDCARVQGDAVTELRRLFLDNWLRQGGPAPRSGLPHRRRARRELLRAAAGRTAVQVLGHPVRRAARDLRRLYLLHIRTAARAILIQNAYFMPDPRVRRALERAARRGVEVRVLVPRDSDVRAVQFASEATFTPLLRAGVAIHEWPGAMMHAKTALIDDWATVGSFNLDRRSLRYNLELNVAATGTPFVAQVERSIRRDLDRSAPIDAAAWTRRPLWRRLVTFVYYLFRGLL